MYGLFHRREDEYEGEWNETDGIHSRIRGREKEVLLKDQKASVDRDSERERRDVKRE